MKKWIKHLGRDFARLLILSGIVSLLGFLYIVWEDSSNNASTHIWLQSAENRLEEQNEQYYNELYERYSRIHRDLNDYQYQTNKRLEWLENRITTMEKSIKEGGISINQTQINGERNER